jgi:hypothetical protein
VKLEVDDGFECSNKPYRYDLISPDAQGGKREVLEQTIDFLRPGGPAAGRRHAPTEYMNDNTK